jgi:hypothetical protein
MQVVQTSHVCKTAAIGSMQVKYHKVNIQVALENLIVRSSDLSSAITQLLRSFCMFKVSAIRLKQYEYMLIPGKPSLSRPRFCRGRLQRCTYQQQKQEIEQVVLSRSVYFLP